MESVLAPDVAGVAGVSWVDAIVLLLAVIAGCPVGGTGWPSRCCPSWACSAARSSVRVAPLLVAGSSRRPPGSWSASRWWCCWWPWRDDRGVSSGRIRDRITGARSLQLDRRSVRCCRR